MPELFLFAGANGAGKSTVAESYLETQRYLNPDGLTERAFLTTFKEWAQRGYTFGVETTLSGRRYQSIIPRLVTEHSYRVHVIFVGLSSPELHIERVALRVKHGGHDIPESDIRRRYVTSLEGLIGIIPWLSSLILLDNSGTSVRFVASIGPTGYSRRTPFPKWAEFILPHMNIETMKKLGL